MTESPSCSITAQSDPVNLVIFGATGDLAMRKIFPALASLCQNNLLSHDTRILAVGRKDLTGEQYHNLIGEKLAGVVPPIRL